MPKLRLGLRGGGGGNWTIYEKSPKSALGEKLDQKTKNKKKLSLKSTIENQQKKKAQTVASVVPYPITPWGGGCNRTINQLKINL